MTQELMNLIHLVMIELHFLLEENLQIWKGDQIIQQTAIINLVANFVLIKVNEHLTPKQRHIPLMTTDDILKHMTISISILYLYLHLVFIAVPKVKSLTLNGYYDLSDYEIVTII